MLEIVKIETLPKGVCVFARLDVCIDFKKCMNRFKKHEQNGSSPKKKKPHEEL